MKYGQELPQDVEKQLDEYIERIKKIQFFKPKLDLKKADTETQINFAVSAFWLSASIEYRKLQTEEARDAAWGAAWGAARDAALDAAWGAAWDAARDAAWGAADIFALNIEGYKTKYPNGNFINLIPLWEAGLYPVWVIDWKFVVYVPQVDWKFPEELISNN